jgi:hypothetical protein
MASSEKHKEPSLTQLEKVPYKWFTVMCCEGKPVPGPMIIEKTTSFLFHIANWKTGYCALNDSKI